MIMRVFSRWMAVAVCAGAVTASAQAPVGAAHGNKACGLLTASELESILGAKVSLSGGGGMDVKGVELCTGQTSTATVLLRLITGLDPGRDRSGRTEMEGIRIAKEMGAQVEVKTYGPITCSTIVPPKSLAEYGFNTTCTVSKATAVAGIEVQVKNQKNMVPIERLRQLAEKVASRF